MADTIIQNYPTCNKLNAEAYAYTLICHSSVCMCLRDNVYFKKMWGWGERVFSAFTVTDKGVMMLSVFNTQ